jgi:hypothetical protein
MLGQAECTNTCYNRATPIMFNVKRYHDWLRDCVGVSKPVERDAEEGPCSY